MRRTLRRSGGALLAGLVLAGAATTGAAPAGAQSSGGNGLASNQCAVLMGWATSIRLPNGSSPYASYSAFGFKDTEARKLNDTLIVFRQDFPYAANGGYQLYPTTYELPTDGVNWPAMQPDSGSVNPYVPGNPVFAPNRRYTMVAAASDIPQANLPGKFAGVANRISWPSDDANGYSLLQRSYNAKSGYDRGGTGGPTNTDWVDVRTYDVHTGQPVPCADIQPSRDAVQRFTPWNTTGWDGIRDLPGLLRPIFPQFGENEAQPPKPNPDLVEFFRVPPSGTGLPGGVVPTPADGCANYLSANLDQRRLAVIRVPKIPSYQPKSLPATALYQQTDAQAYNLTIYGQFRESFSPGTPFTYAIGNEDIRTDDTGGATFVVWPRNLNVIERALVFRLARSRGWNLLQGNAQAPGRYAQSMWIRVNGPASTYQGGTYPTASRTGVPCMFGPQATLPAGSGLVAQPPGTPFSTLGSEWSATPALMGSATPQGVQCRVLEYLNGRCLRRLQRHISDTGGNYYAN